MLLQVKGEGFHLALTPGALAADTISYGCACSMFPGLSTWFYSPPRYNVRFTFVPLGTTLRVLEASLGPSCTDVTLFTRSSAASMEAWAVYSCTGGVGWAWGDICSIEGSPLAVSPFAT